jgi:methionyl-tRNA formyltransferase
MNLHTGLSPYVKGGPNCTNWCIANNEWHLTGNTIMWLNAGIDSGNIITTETVDIRSASSLTQAHYLVMEHAHNLYGRAIQYVLSQKAPYNSIPQQSIAKGTLYLTKMWNSEKRKALLNNWKKRSSASLQIPVKTVPLP